MVLEFALLREQQRERVVHFNGREMIGLACKRQAKDIGKETRGGELVARRNNRVVENNAHAAGVESSCGALAAATPDTDAAAPRSNTLRACHLLAASISTRNSSSPAAAKATGTPSR